MFEITVRLVHPLSEQQAQILLCYNRIIEYGLLIKIKHLKKSNNKTLHHRLNQGCRLEQGSSDGWGPKQTKPIK